jgi:hypothetical protein
VGNRYSFTSEGLANLKVYGVGPDEVWVALHGRRRLSRPLGDDAAAIFGVTSTGRYLMVLVVESTSEDNDWDIVAAREMSTEEIEVFDRYAGGQR